MVTIKDVAKDAGVSVGTVSNVLNGGKVGEDRKRRVEASIEKLGYRVNTLARGMRVQNTDFVVVILPAIMNPFFSMLLQDLEREVYARQNRVILCISDMNAEKERQYIEMAKQNCVNGIIGVTYSKIENYLDEDLPFVSIERQFHSDIPCVSSDNYGGGRMAAEQLVRGGSKKLLFIQIISSVDNEVRKRRTGFEAYCDEHQIPYSCIEFSEAQVKSVYSAFSEAPQLMSVLQSCINTGDPETSVDGIFAGTDHLAYVVCDNIRKMGLRVPEDIQVIGYDGLRVMNCGELYVSSICQDTALIAKTAADCLFQKIHGQKAHSVTDIPVRFMDGGTTRRTGETENE